MSEGRSYNGSIRDGRYDGHGEFAWDHGELRWKGNFKRGKAEGEGKLIIKDERGEVKTECTYEDGQP